MRVSAAPSAKQITSSVGWSSLQIIVEQASLFLVFVILARLLDPTTFGIVAVAVIVSELGKVIASNGLATAVIQTCDLDEAAADTAFWTNFAVAILIGVVMIGMAIIVGGPWQQVQLANALAALAPVPFITSLGAIHAARNIRGFGYRALALRTLAANVIAGFVAILLAIGGYGIWALVAQRLIAESVLTIASWMIYPWMPRARFQPRSYHTLLTTGWHVTLTNLVFQLGSRVNEIVLTFALSYTAVGVIRIGFRLMDLTTQFAVRPFSSVALPALARVAHDRPRMAHQFHQIQMMSALVLTPAMVGLGLVADPLIPLVFGPQWTGVIPVTQVLSLMALPICLNQFATPVLTAVGRADVGFRIAIVQLLLGLFFCIIAAPYGATWVAIAYVTRAYITLPWVAFNLLRFAGVRPAVALRSVAPAVACSALMAIMVIPIDYWLLRDLAPVLRTAAKVAIGGGIFTLAALIFAGPKLKNAIQQLRRPNASQKNVAPADTLEPIVPA
ncbi:lipopolysaccharide biosynthesis protein [Sphingobium xenophagum]|nr:lipopolysaccharide biosynthesis protein [Sphingobium xenophagum]